MLNLSIQIKKFNITNNPRYCFQNIALHLMNIKKNQKKYHYLNCGFNRLAIANK